MSSVQYLRELISDRLTAAAEEIFTEFEKTIIQYKEEIDRQRRLLDVVWKPHIPLHTIELPLHYVYQTEEVLADLQLCNQERNCGLHQEDPGHLQNKEEQEKLCTSLDQEDPESLQIKEEQEELCTSLDQEDPKSPQIKEEQQEQEELGASLELELPIQNQESDTFVATPVYKKSDHREPKPNSDELLSHSFSAAESPDQEGSEHVDSGSTRYAELKPKNRHHRHNSHSNNVDNTPMSGRHCDNDKANKPPTCSKAFMCKSDLKKHHRTHTGEKLYSCKKCEKSFRHGGSLKVHMRSHTGEKPYPCNTCGKRFSDSSVFKRHVVIHTGEKPYSCETCGKSFSQRAHLTTHMRSHSSEKPYSCETCGKRFSAASSHIRHMVIHKEEKPYSCRTCGKCFRRQDNLALHMRTHTGVKPYFCETCGKCYSHGGSLKFHMTVHTGEKLSS